MKNMAKLRNDMISKWIDVPYSILVVLAAGASYNLFAYFQQIGAIQGYGKETMTAIKYTVLIGYYLGIIPGAIVRMNMPVLAYGLAAILALICFPILGYIAENGEGGTGTWILMMTSLFFGAMSGSFATITAIVTVVKSFPKLEGILLIVILIAYYKIAPYLEFSIRSGFFEEPSLLWYFVVLGVILALIYAVAIVAVREITIDGFVENLIQDYDRAGLFAFVFLELCFLASFFVVALIYENWFIGAILMISFIVLNFFVVGIAFKVVYDKVSETKKFESRDRTKRREMKFEQMLGESKYHSILWASFIVVGVCSTFNFNLFQIAFSYGKVDSADDLLDSFWASDMFARFGGGLFAFLLFHSVNGYTWAFGAAVTAAIGFGLVLLTEALGAAFLFTGGCFIGFGLGMFWVIVPYIVMEDAGEANFGLNWGLTLLMNAIGMIVFGEIFDWIYDWQANGSDQCKGGHCVLIQMIFFGLLCFIAAGLAWFGRVKDNSQTPTTEKPKKKRDSRNKEDRAKSKDKKVRDSRAARDSKSKDRKSRDKSGTKTKDRDASKKKDRSGSKSKDRSASKKRGTDAKSKEKKKARA